MSAHARRGALLAIVAALLLANPLYVGLVVDEPRSRSPTGYTATAIDPTNASDQRLLVYEVGDDEVLDLGQFAEANEYQPYGDEYRAPGRAASAIRRATTSGTARADADDVAFTLRRVGATHRFVAVERNDTPQYYRFAVESTDDGVTVTATAVDGATVADYVLHHDARLYSSLPGYQRETMRKVLEADEYGYRPYNDEFVDLTDDVVVRGDTYYLVRPAMHVDDFGPSTKFLVTAALTLLGLLALVAAVVFTGLAYRRPE